MRRPLSSSSTVWTSTNQIPTWGLFYSYDDRVVSLPLLSVRAVANIKELAAQVKLTHTYGNDVDISIEANYSFPIPARAAVCSFVMIKQDGTRVVGYVQEKNEARETYEAAIAQGKQTALMEQQTADVFQLAVGNIQPKERVQIELVYATELSEDEENDSVRFHLPVHVGARYGQAPSTSFNAGIFSQPLFTTALTHSPFLKISANVEAVASIVKIGCPSHSVSTELGPDPTLPHAHELPFSNYARVSLSSDSALDKDFVLTVKSAGLDSPRCIAELHPSLSHNTVALGLTLVPRFKLPDLNRQEFIFMVDRSGSMQNQRIAAARKALVVMLRSLPANDSLFQIMSFGSHSSSLWTGGSRPYNQATLEEATQHVDGMQADYGGTDIGGALRQCFTVRKLDRPTSVFVLTDGNAWDLDAVLDKVKTSVSSAPQKAYLRVSVLGIGNSASTAMCEGIARVGHGSCMMVGEEETSFTGKIARMLKAARTPLISDITVDWGVPAVKETKLSKLNEDDNDSFVMVATDEESGKGKERKIFNIFDETVDLMQTEAEPVPPPPQVVLSPPSPVQQSPFKIHAISSGIRLNVYAILQGRTVPKNVTLKGSIEDGSEIKLSVPVSFSNLPNEPDTPPAIHTLAARKIIQDLGDGQHSIVNPVPDDPGHLKRTVEASIARLGKLYSISTSQTSFVVVDESRSTATASVNEDDALPGNARKRLRQPDLIRIPDQASQPGGRRRGGFCIFPMRNEATDLIFQDRESNVRRPTGSGKAARKQLAPAPAARKTASSPPRKRLLRRKHHAAAETFESQSHTPMDPLEALARLQSFNGCFSLSVLSIIQLIDGADEARAALFDGISDEVFATVIAMAFLNTKLGPEVERDSWEAMYDKARAFVENTLQTGEVSLGVNELETKAVSILF